MLPRWTLGVVFAVAAAVAASAVFWGLKLFVSSPTMPPHASLAAPAMPAAPDWTRLFGVEVAPVVVEAAAPPPDSRFQLIGVVAARAALGQGRASVALIAVDGKPPRAYRVGNVIDGQTVLQGVQTRGATLGPRGGAAVVSLQMPPLPVAATGVPGGNAAAPGAGPGGFSVPQPIVVPPPVMPTVNNPPTSNTMPSGRPFPMKPNLGETANPGANANDTGTGQNQPPADFERQRVRPGRADKSQMQ
jgi:general secretion pathway protein C